MRVLLLNPPGRQRYLRDYYCSTVSKAGYYWHPIDLLMQSAFLRDKAEVHVLDAVAHRLSPARALASILGFRQRRHLSGLISLQKLIPANSYRHNSILT